MRGWLVALCERLTGHRLGRWALVGRPCVECDIRRRPRLERTRCRWCRSVRLRVRRLAE